MLLHCKVKTWCNCRVSILWYDALAKFILQPGYMCSTAQIAATWLHHWLYEVISWLGSLQNATVQIKQPALFLPFSARKRCISQLSNDCCACKRVVDLIICNDSSLFWRGQIVHLYAHCCMEFAYWTSSFWTLFLHHLRVSLSKECSAPEVVCSFVPFAYCNPGLLAF